MNLRIFSIAISSFFSYASDLNIILQMADDTVRVALRIRPLVESEIEKRCQTCLEIVPGEQQVCILNTGKAFTYNYVFPPDVGQKEFYEVAIKRLIHNIFQDNYLSLIL